MVTGGDVGTLLEPPPPPQADNSTAVASTVIDTQVIDFIVCPRFGLSFMLPLRTIIHKKVTVSTIYGSIFVIFK